MRTRDQRLEKAAERLAVILDDHFAKIKLSEREAKWRTMCDAIAKIETRVKSANRVPASR